MNQPRIVIDDITVKAYGKIMLSHVSLTIYPGQVHVIMGPNGAGKSTLSKVLAGHPDYEIVSGSIMYQGEDVGKMAPEERVSKGIFLSFQNPVEIAGVSNISFLKSSHNAVMVSRGKTPLETEHFELYVRKICKEVGLSEEMLYRDVNVGFSGGEKKRNEIVQMSVLYPTVAILDEIDSGLDVDGLKIVAQGICKIKQEDTSLLLITHYNRLLSYIKPDKVHIMVAGKIVRSGDQDLADELERIGFQGFLGDGQGPL